MQSVDGVQSEEEVLDFFRRLLRGDFKLGRSKRGSRGRKVFRLIVFVSSTFTDTHFERNIFFTKIVPYLRELADQHGIEITFIDMRYGIRDLSTLLHMTWPECRNSIVRSLKESSEGSVCFVSLQSEKYGYMPIHRQYGKLVYEERYGTWSDDVKAVADEWYIFYLS